MPLLLCESLAYVLRFLRLHFLCAVHFGELFASESVTLETETGLCVRRCVGRDTR